MISYRPVPELTPGRKGFKAAVAAMALAAVLGTTAFAPADDGTAVAAPASVVTAVVSTGVPGDQAPVRRQDTGGSLEQGAAGPLTL